MTGIILYQSKYGATKQYADWLAEATGFPVVETKKADIRQVAQCDTIILGGGVYASGIAGLSFLRRHIGRLQGRKVIVFAVGAAPCDGETLQRLAAHNMKGALAGVPLFYCRGAWDMAAMGFIDRTLCAMLKKASQQDPASVEPWMASLMTDSPQPCDWTDRGSITPILREAGF